MSPMRRLGGIAWGRLELTLYWAERRYFTHPGVHLWTGSRHVRILPVPRHRWAR